MDDNKKVNSERDNGNNIPLYERPGRLDPDRHVPVERPENDYINVHYEEKKNGYYKDSDSPEFTGMSANAMNPFEDKALLNGEVKPRSTGVKTGAGKIESKYFVPETDTEDVRTRIRETIDAPEIQTYIPEEDIAASSDAIASAMSGVETGDAQKSGFAVLDASRLKMLIYLLAVLVVAELAGIVLLIVL